MSETRDDERHDGDWFVYQGMGEPHDGIEQLPDPPPWRRFGEDPDTGLLDVPSSPVGRRPADVLRARSYRPDPEIVEAVNAALYLRRPLLVTGRPGAGKSTLAFSIAHELRLGPVLYWPITSRSVLREALYDYDAIGRLQEANLRRGSSAGVHGSHGGAPGAPASATAPEQSLPTVPDIGRYLRLASLGTALLPWRRPRVLLIDELDKGDIDLPNDLLNVFEEGQFEITELARLPADQQPVTVRTADGQEATLRDGRVRCHTFPIVVITNNGEREFPPAFLRRCLSVRIQTPSETRLREIVTTHLGEQALADGEDYLTAFVDSRNRAEVSTDQLLNLVFLASAGRLPDDDESRRLVSLLLRPLDEAP